MMPCMREGHYWHDAATVRVDSTWFPGLRGSVASAPLRSVRSAAAQRLRAKTMENDFGENFDSCLIWKDMPGSNRDCFAVNGSQWPSEMQAK